MSFLLLRLRQHGHKKKTDGVTRVVANEANMMACCWMITGRNEKHTQERGEAEGEGRGGRGSRRGRSSQNLQWKKRSELWQLIFTMANKRNGVHKFQVTLHQPQKPKRRSRRSRQEREREGGGLQLHCTACQPALVVCVCASSVPQQTLN